MAQALAPQVDGVQMSGLEQGPPGLGRLKNSAEELFLTAYLGTLAQWLFERPVEIEMGWGALHQTVDMEETIEGSRRLVAQGLAGVNALTLIDPDPRLFAEPPWALRSGLEHIGLLNRYLEPKKHAETCLKELLTGEPGEKIEDFIDISLDKYLTDPDTHLPRLWEHFRESCFLSPGIGPSGFRPRCWE